MLIINKSLLQFFCCISPLIVAAQIPTTNTLQSLGNNHLITANTPLKIVMNDRVTFSDKLIYASTDSLYFQEKGGIAKSNINYIAYSRKRESYQRFNTVYLTLNANLVAFSIYSFPYYETFGIVVLATSPIWALIVPITCYIIFSKETIHITRQEILQITNVTP